MRTGTRAAIDVARLHGVEMAETGETITAAAAHVMHVMTWTGTEAEAAVQTGGMARARIGGEVDGATFTWVTVGAGMTDGKKGHLTDGETGSQTGCQTGHVGSTAGSSPTISGRPAAVSATVTVIVTDLLTDSLIDGLTESPTGSLTGGNVRRQHRRPANTNGAWSRLRLPRSVARLAPLPCKRSQLHYVTLALA